MHARGACEFVGWEELLFIMVCWLRVRYLSENLLPERWFNDGMATARTPCASGRLSLWAYKGVCAYSIVIRDKIRNSNDAVKNAF